MGIDRILAKIRPPPKLEAVVMTPDDIQRDFVPGSGRLYAMFPHWRGRFDHFEKLKNRISDAGAGYLCHQFPVGMLSPDHEQTTRNFKLVQDDVSADLAFKANDYIGITAIGVSLGCVNAMMVANNVPQIDRLVLVVPGHCLAESMWNGVRTQNLRKEIEAQGVSLDQLKEYWHDLAPENNIDNLNGRNIKVYLSRADEIIPYGCGRRLAEKLEEQGLNPDVNVNLFLGHYFTIKRFLRRFNVSRG